MLGLFSSSKSVARSGILQGYTDHHCHLLPGVDDGVQEPEETLAILELMQTQGVKEVWFTPHVMEDMPNRPEGLHKAFENLTDSLTSHLSPLTLNLAAEHMLDSEFSLERALQLPLPGNNLLVETSYFSPPFRLKTILANILKTGVFPLLAHPCRYRYMSYRDYEELKAMGVHFQLNLPALTGHYGPEVKKRAEWLLHNNYYLLTGTDTHSLESYQEFLDSKISNKNLNRLNLLLNKTQNITHNT